MHLSGGYVYGERSSRAVSHQVELRSKPASAAAQSVVGRFVRVPLKTFLSAPAAARLEREQSELGIRQYVRVLQLLTEPPALAGTDYQ